MYINDILCDIPYFFLLIKETIYASADRIEYFQCIKQAQSCMPVILCAFTAAPVFTVTGKKTVHTVCGTS